MKCDAPQCAHTSTTEAETRASQIVGAGIRGSILKNISRREAALNKTQGGGNGSGPDPKGRAVPNFVSFSG